MPKVDSTPDTLRPYIFHGVDLTWADRDKEAIGQCPWCGREGKFSVSIATGEWQCFLCKTGTDKGGGNAMVFLRILWRVSEESTSSEDYAALREDRGLLYPDTLMHWGVCRSSLSGRWLVPAFNKERNLCQLYVYYQGKKKVLVPTPTLGHQLHGVNLWNDVADVVFICEGPWDGMALWEVLGGAKETEEGLSVTGNAQYSLRSMANVVAVPGCGSVGEPFKRWTSLFSGSAVNLLFDNDYPRQHPTTGAPVAPAGWAALERATNLLSGSKEPPALVNILHWGDDGYTRQLPDGMDVRDVFTEGDTLAFRVKQLQQLLDDLVPAPEDWVLESGEGEVVEGLGCLDCQEYSELTMAWRKALKWTSGLDHALSVMLASILSVRSVGDQLWIKVIGPAACGKSTLCEAVSVNREYVIAKSTIRGFHSGYKTDREGSEDNSLVSKLRNKTLVTKDGDTLLQSPNLGQILAEGRDLYDRTSRTEYRNKMGRDYEGVNMTWLLCGTSSLRTIDDSELGERFLDCVIMDQIDEELEDAILWRVANRTERNLGIEADGKAETLYDVELCTAMQLTGGYVGYLRNNAVSLLTGVSMDEVAKRQCIDIGKFVAFMRARPSRKQAEVAERELASRLVSQHTRLAKCLAAVLNIGEVDSLVMRRVIRVGLDTARGITLDILKQLHPTGDEGLEISTLSHYIGQTSHETGRMLRFLRRIGVVEQFTPLISQGVRGRPRWKLSKQLRQLYGRIVRATTS